MGRRNPAVARPRWPLSVLLNSYTNATSQIAATIGPTLSLNKTATEPKNPAHTRRQVVGAGASGGGNANHIARKIGSPDRASTWVWCRGPVAT